MTSGAPWLDKAIWEAKRTNEPKSASEFGGSIGYDPHAHADPPATHRGYPNRYMPISEPASPDDISIGSRPRGTGGTP